MANGQVKVRANVWTLSRSVPDGWHPALIWYGEAIRHLKRITDPADPRSWVHLSNIHGTEDEPQTWPAGVTDRHWNACQHASWYFLPWHRMYLHHFEKIVAGMVMQLGGPSDWSLPFWNYDPADAATLALPPAFLAPERNGAPNPLFVWQRRTAIMNGTGVPPEIVETSGWDDEFTSDDPAVGGFGGPRTGWSHTGGDIVGDLESEPHGTVHMAVGGWDARGRMSLFQTAGLDPIFWLHHANIDRLWEQWRNEGHSNPAESAWLDGEFEFGSGTFHTKMRVGEVLSTSAAPLLYQYEGVSVPAPPPAEDARERLMAKRIPSELIGSSDGPVALGASASVTVPLSEPVGPRAWMAQRGIDAAVAPARTYLVLENVTGTAFASGLYGVFVGVPDGEDPISHPERRVGTLSMFGVPESSATDEQHSGSGRTFSFDITRVVSELDASEDLDPAALGVRLVARDPVPGMAGDVQVGAVKLYRR